MRVLSIAVESRRRTELIDVTQRVADALRETGLRSGALLVFVTHTTAGVTINENADPSVRRDLLMALERLVPRSLPFAHLEGNSDAHVKAGLIGSSVVVPVVEGELRLGAWQGIYFCEFDGPRRRRLLVQPLLS
jgi:secondary thiamine-phosphate synthase enzyme